MTGLRAPFPWFGGKRRAAHLVWPRFGDVPNYVEPFAGSLAVLLSRPTEPRIETVNDIDCYLSNFWRAVTAAPEEVAEYADWPVNEADLHARHRWLVAQDEFRERMKTDPDYYDAKIAGWWVWGLCQWIGSGWCIASNWGVGKKRAHGGAKTAEQAIRPHIGTGGIGVHRLRELAGAAGWRKRPVLAHGNRGIPLVSQQMPMLRGDGGAAGAGIHASGLPGRQLPDLGGNGGAAGKGVTASGLLSRKRPSLTQKGGVRMDRLNALAMKLPKMDRGTESRMATTGEAILAWMLALRDRLRRVRVCCVGFSAQSRSHPLVVSSILTNPLRTFGCGHPRSTENTYVWHNGRSRVERCSICTKANAAVQNAKRTIEAVPLPDALPSIVRRSFCKPCLEGTHGKHPGGCFRVVDSSENALACRCGVSTPLSWKKEIDGTRKKRYRNASLKGSM